LESVLKRQNYNFDIPEHWYKSEPDLWAWSPDHLSTLGICIDRHEEWADEDPVVNSYPRTGSQSISLIPWHELDDDIIVECQSQIFAYNDVCTNEVGKLALLNNGEVGTLRKVEFRLATDQERAMSHAALFPTSFIVCGIEVETPEKYYEKVRDYDVRFVDHEQALMPSVDMRSLQVKIIRTIHREKNKIVSLEEWKRKKGLLKESETEDV
tara:strand:+ start:3664 stop:4296 length:633 start_codon:yes stop_codon:yes gene_type:complete